MLAYRIPAMIGETLGHYRIVEKLGEGGMGVVYRARDPRLERDVALKVLPADALADEAARARLLEEARTASALNHPHICAVYDVGEADGQLYIAMERIEGQVLSALIPRDGVPVETAIRYATQIADALAHAHERGVVHRDLKTSNVLITADGRAKVLDFGLARRLEQGPLDDSTHSHRSLLPPDALVGTLAYLSPEVLEGAEADARSDVWALGVVLYEMVSGEIPFLGRTGFELTSAILREPPRPLPLRVPANVRGIIQRCLTKQPGQRYQRASEARAALEAIGASLAAPAPARRAARAINSLAVLPFQNATADPEAEYLSDGISESLIHLLAQLPRLRVMARSTVFRYKGQGLDPLAIGRELEVRAVLTGRVSQRGDTLLISAELVDVANGWQLWGEQYNRKVADIVAIQSEIAGEISERLRLRLTGADRKRLAKRYTGNTEAYQLYLKGRYYWNKRTDADLSKGVEFFSQAIENDPGFALAYAGLADSYYLLASTAYAALSPEAALPKARAAAQKALELDDTLAEAHASLASILMDEWNWAAAEKEFKRSIRLKPGYATAHQWYGFFLTAHGRLDEAIAHAQRAQELDPLSVIINRDLGLVLSYAGRVDEAIQQYCKTLELDPNFALAHQSLGRAYAQKGMHREALAALETATNLAPDSVAMSSALAQFYAVTGRTSEARKILEQLLQRTHRSYVSPTSIAIIYAGLGEIDQAFDWLEKAYTEHNVGLLTLKVHPVFDPLRSDPRFGDLLRRVGLA